MTSSATRSAADLARPKRRAARLASGPVILEAATMLFLRNGYLGTSVDDIAALAHVSKQTVYTHFGGSCRADQLLGIVLPCAPDSRYGRGRPAASRRPRRRRARERLLGDRHHSVSDCRLAGRCAYALHDETIERKR